ncbi:MULTISPECIES: hypothetical protein [Bacillus cereus group]|nr:MULTISPECIES: hypothetical protein [Bacillus cereus group]
MLNQFMDAIIILIGLFSPLLVPVSIEAIRNKITKGEFFPIDTNEKNND